MIDPRFLRRLRAAIDARSVIDRPADIEPYLIDCRHLYHGRAALVLRPGSVAEVSTILALCNDAGVGVVPHGGNTGYCGRSVPDETGNQLVLSLARLNKIRAVESRSYSVTAEAGCVLARVQEAALAAERYFPLSLGADGARHHAHTQMRIGPAGHPESRKTPGLADLSQSVEAPASPVRRDSRS